MKIKTLIAAATLCLCATPLLAQTEMHVASWLPPTHPQNPAIALFS